MKTIFIVWAGLCLAAGAEAAKLKKGDWEANVTSNPNRLFNRHSYTVGAGIQHFVADQLSIGMEGEHSQFSWGASSYKVVPVVTKYFLLGDVVAPYVSLSPVGLFKVSTNSYWYSSVRLGTKFFLTDSIAIGPALDFKKYWKGNWTDSSLLGVVSVHF